MENASVRLAAMADLHYTKHCAGRLERVFADVSKSADLLLLGGDLTDFGLVDEAALLAADLRNHLRIPAVAVLGNHDFEGGQATQIRETLEAAGVPVLDGECHRFEHVGIAGVCGFGGGFGSYMLNAWGEPIIKAFVQEAVDQALRLETALARLDTPRRVALLHYAPIRETVIGEPEPIFPFLGSTRLEGPLNRFGVDVIFHGHAHRGTPEAATSAGIPVFNVALPLLEKTSPEKPYRIFEIPPVAA